MKKITLSFIYFFAFSITTFSQLQFTNYTNKNDIRGIAVKGDSVWIATTGGVVLRNIDGTLIATYTTDEGLPRNYVSTVFADSQGNIWCGTSNGVVKFDDSGMTQVPEVYSAELIFEDSQGNIWFAKYWGGVTKFDGSAWTTYTTSDGLAYDYVYAIFEDSQGNMWFGYGYYEFGVTKFNGTNWTTYTTNEGLASNRVYDIEEDNSGNMWFGTQDSGVSKFDGSAWTTYSGSNVLLGDNVYDILNDSSGRLWFGMPSYGVNMYDGSNWYSYTSSDSLSSNYNYYIFEDSQENIWFHGDYLDKFDGTQFTNYTTADGLSGYGMYENMLAEDKTGNLWIGHNYDYKGLDKFDGSTFTNYLVDSEINSNSFNDILKDHNGDLWFAVSGADSLLKFDGTNWSYPGYHMGINTSWAYKIFEDKDSNLWFGYYELGKWDGNNWTYYDYTTRSGSQYIQAIAQDLSGNLWFGGTYNYNADGVNKFDGVTWTTYTTADGLDTTAVYDILADSQGNVWFAHGYYGTGVTKYDGSTFTIITPANGIYSDRVYSVFEDSKGNIWLGQNYAVSKFDGNNWTYFSSSEGFPGGYVYDITEDEFGVLWFATGYGLVKYDSVNWAHYTLENSGLADNYLRAIEIDDQGNKWVGGGYGLSVVSCQDPVASFTHSGASYPDTVEFTNTSTLVDDFSRYEWDFDNNGVTDTTTQDAKHVFNTAGTYPVKLIAWNDNCSDTIVQSITVPDSSLAGVYTIGTSGDYLNFTEAVNALINYGVHGQVTFNVESGTYNEQIIIPEIYHASGTSTIIFQSESGDSTDVILTYSADSTNHYTLMLDGADYIIFKELTLSSISEVNPRVIELNNGACYNKFTNCYITGAVQSGYYYYKQFVGASGQLNNYNELSGNLFQDGVSAIYLDYSNSIGNQIMKNKFINQVNFALTLSHQDSCLISENIIQSSSSSYFWGIYTHYCDDSLRILKNQINIIAGTGLYISRSNVSVSKNNIVANNVIHTTNVGICNHASSYVNYFYNSVNITGNNTGSRAMEFNHGATGETFSNVVVKNNIFYNQAQGYAIYCDTTIGFTSDYNDLYSNGTNLGYWYNTDATDLTAWQSISGQDANSISIDPVYWSDTDLHTSNLALQAGTPLAEVTTDIDGDIRDLVTPYIGADKYIPGTENDILTFSFMEQTSPAIIDTNTYTITIEVANGTDLTSLVTTFTISYDAKITIQGTLQESGVTVNDFSSSVTYTVTSGEGNPQDWVVTVTEYVPIIITSYQDYLEDFENDYGDWYAVGTNSSWQYGAPAGQTINSAASGTRAWVTNLTGDYNQDEVSYVSSPQFDFSSLNYPKIEFKVWWDAEGFYDGANFQYKEGTGAWKTLGTYEGDDNWYNSSYLYSIEKGFGFDINNSAGWTGDDEWGYGSNGWVTVSHALTSIDKQYFITFRIAFASNSSYQNDGIAIDDVNIYDDPTGIDPVETGLSDIQIYPNPNEGKFRLVYNGERDIDLKLQLINLQGQVILSEQIETGNKFSKEFELDYLPPGLYYFRLKHKEGVVVKKMVVR